MANTADISRGLILNLDGSLYTVVEFGENKTARAAAKVWAKLKGVDNNRSIEKTWNSGDTIYPVRVEKRVYQFLYKDDTGYNFMDNQTFEQIALQESAIDAPQYLKEGQEVGVMINTENDQVLGAERAGNLAGAHIAGALADESQELVARGEKRGVELLAQDELDLERLELLPDRGLRLGLGPLLPHRGVRRLGRALLLDPPRNGDADEGHEAAEQGEG